MAGWSNVVLVNAGAAGSCPALGRVFHDPEYLPVPEKGITSPKGVLGRIKLINGVIFKQMKNLI